MKVIRSVTLAISILIPASAAAADLPVRPVAPAPVPTSIPVYNWTGIYFGINGGYAFGKQDPLTLFSNDYDEFEYGANGWLVGGTFGAQIQSGHVVLGIEGDINWADISGSGTAAVTRIGVLQGTATISSKVSSISTIRMRAGYAQDNLLYFATVGLAATSASATVTQTVGFVCNAGSVPCSSKPYLHPGITAGGGIEYGITRNISSKFEYLWVGAGAINTLNAHLIRAGLNWRFGG